MKTIEFETISISDPVESFQSRQSQLDPIDYDLLINKPDPIDISSKANIDSQIFTGTPSLPTGTTGVTQTAGDSSTKLATTAFVTSVDILKAPIASPTFTGTTYASGKFRLPVGSNLY